MHFRKRASPLQALSLGICLACFVALASTFAFLGARYHATARLDPSPQEAPSADVLGFPSVDWDYWKQVNPHVVGWITIPNTMVDYPIVQAQKDNPGYYLDHDVFGNWNFAGCPYLDADCAKRGLEESQNAVVFAHNLGYGDESMFAAIAHYADASFAEEHRMILVQTPTAKMAFEAQGAAVLHGSADSKRMSFDGTRDLRDWLQARLAECQVLIRTPDPQPERVFTLCTCSYNRWENERTLLYAFPAD